MSYIEKAKQNKANADKAAAFDNMQRKAKEQQVYDSGLKDAYGAVEQEMMRRAQEQAMDRQMREAADRYANRGANDYNPTLGQAIQDGKAWVGRKLNGLADSFVDAVVGTPEQQNRYSAEGEKLRQEVEAENARRMMMQQQGMK